MTIAAKRFSFLDNETNVGVADFYSQTGSDILNNAPLDIEDITMQLDGFLKERNTGEIEGLLAQVNESAIGVSRLTKDFFSSKIDLTDISLSDLESLTKSFLSGNQLAGNMMKQIGFGCKEGMLGSHGSRRRGRSQIDCGRGMRSGRGGKCDVNAFASMMSKLSGKEYNPRLIDANALERMISGVGGQGYNLGLCDVYSNVTNGITDQGILGRAASTLLSKVAGRGDMIAVVDIGRSLLGTNVLNSVPNISNLILSNFSMPDEITNRKLPAFFDTFGGSMDSIDPRWMTSDDGYVSSKNFSCRKAPDSFEMLRAKVFNAMPNFNTDEFGGVADIPDVAYLTAGAGFEADDAYTAIGAEFPSVSFEW